MKPTITERLNRINHQHAHLLAEIDAMKTELRDTLKDWPNMAAVTNLEDMQKKINIADTAARQMEPYLSAAYIMLAIDRPNQPETPAPHAAQGNQ
jgi:hypothetical protein